MSLETKSRPITEKEETRFVELLESGLFEQAKAYANELRAMGVLQAVITRAGREVFVGYQMSQYPNSHTAEELAQVFQDYHWTCWLSPQLHLGKRIPI